MLMWIRLAGNVTRSAQAVPDQPLIAKVVIILISSPAPPAVRPAPTSTTKTQAP
jgi:hypothetical protein